MQVYKNNIEKYINELKTVIASENNGNNIGDFKDSYFEWEVEELDKLIKGLKEKDKTEFIHNHYKEDDYFEVNLKKVDVYNDDDDYCCAEFLIAFRNYDDNPQFTAFTSSLYCFTNTNLNINNDNGGYRIKIYKRDYEKSIEPLILNNKVIIGIYIRTYFIHDEINTYISDLKNSINDNNYEIQGENYYEWSIEDLTKLDENYNKSSLFEIGGYKW
ncbi:hypothetical protein PIROE2DRAFT_17247 [Piromyces sp. E2]|nr:hypothetical protein PIROE2DRAFT_17247 [Piromyces sp. E2]|eukprot:OUM57686.1 hypothetical protein PIROE2DRAFT_17247 [Piromyces sp. E2]